jgi:hypothetical protein
MPWIYRIIERDDGSWTCSFGRTDFDTHRDLAAAVAHIRVLAAAVDCDDIRAHRSDGTVEAVPSLTNAGRHQPSSSAVLPSQRECR